MEKQWRKVRLFNYIHKLKLGTPMKIKKGLIRTELLWAKIRIRIKENCIDQTI